MSKIIKCIQCALLLAITILLAISLATKDYNPIYITNAPSSAIYNYVTLCEREKQKESGNIIINYDQYVCDYTLEQVNRETFILTCYYKPRSGVYSGEETPIVLRYKVKIVGDKMNYQKI